MTYPNGGDIPLALRVSELEYNRGVMAADISALRAEYRTDLGWIKQSLERIEERLEERPSRAEMVGVSAPKSVGPRLDLDGPFGWKLKLKRVPSVYVTLLLLVAEAIVIYYLFPRK